MAGGGTAPSMKMSDVFLLVGMSLLLGGLIMHAWVDPMSLDEEEPSLNGGASMLTSDTITFDVMAISESTVTIVIEDESGEAVREESWNVAAGDDLEFEFMAEDGGFYTYNVTFANGEGEVLVDVDRQTMLDFIAYPIGIAFVGYGLYKRSLETEEVLDAELEG